MGLDLAFIPYAQFPLEGPRESGMALSQTPVPRLYSVTAALHCDYDDKDRACVKVTLTLRKHRNLMKNIVSHSPMPANVDEDLLRQSAASRAV